MLKFYNYSEIEKCDEIIEFAHIVLVVCVFDNKPPATIYLQLRW